MIWLEYVAAFFLGVGAAMFWYARVFKPQHMSYDDALEFARLLKENVWLRERLEGYERTADNQ